MALWALGATLELNHSFWGTQSVSRIEGPRHRAAQVETRRSGTGVRDNYAIALTR